MPDEQPLQRPHSLRPVDNVPRDGAASPLSGSPNARAKGQVSKVMAILKSNAFLATAAMAAFLAAAVIAVAPASTSIGFVMPSDVATSR